MKQALKYFEGNNYEQAFERMKNLVEQKCSIENLHNLAWLYVYEEENLALGKMLAEEVVNKEPTHYFPYVLLSEIYLKQDDLCKVEFLLKKGLEMERNPSAIHNLGVLYAKKKQWGKAAKCFGEISTPSSYRQMIEIYCRIQAGDNKAKDLLLQWDEESDDFIGWTEAGDLWIELGELQKSKEMFEREWDTTIFSSYSINRFCFVLNELGKDEQLLTIQKETLARIEEEIIAVQEERDWSDEEKQEQLQHLKDWHNEIITLPNKLKQGFKPPFEIDLYVEGGCYLFGCVQHNHPFYPNN